MMEGSLVLHDPTDIVIMTVGIRSRACCLLEMVAGRKLDSPWIEVKVRYDKES